VKDTRREWENEGADQRSRESKVQRRREKKRRTLKRF